VTIAVFDDGLAPRRDGSKRTRNFILRLADELMDGFVGCPGDRCELSSPSTAQPLAMLVIADLLGVPESEPRT